MSLEPAAKSMPDPAIPASLRLESGTAKAANPARAPATVSRRSVTALPISPVTAFAPFDKRAHPLSASGDIHIKGSSESPATVVSGRRAKFQESVR